MADALVHVELFGGPRAIGPGVRWRSVFLFFLFRFMVLQQSVVDINSGPLWLIGPFYSPERLRAPKGPILGRGGRLGEGARNEPLTIQKKLPRLL